MPAPRSSSSSSRSGGKGKRTSTKSASASSGGSSAKSSRRTTAKRGALTSAATGGSAKSSAAGRSRRTAAGARRSASSVTDGLSNLMEQLVNRIIRPLDLVMLTRDRIQETLDEAAERGRLTRSDANDLASELIRKGRQQTDDLLADFEQLLGRGRDQVGSAAKRARHSDPVDQLVRAADRARRSVGVGSSFPISGYHELTTSQVTARLDGLSASELRKVRDYETRHANRKSVLEAIEKKLG
jgi:polyhydroxyalkanoate synthesis regulator phasin